MNELDFDELDKAVNSLMEKTTDGSEVAATQTAVQDDTQVKSESDSRLSESVQESSVPPKTATMHDATESNKPEETEPVPTPEEKPTESLSLTKPPKRSGRFMDVVHPSSDMRPKLMAKPHGETTITPLNDDIKPESPAEEPSKKTTLAETSAVDSKPDDAWPDPIDMMQKSDEEPSDKEEETPDSLAEQESDSEPNGSPFLPNTKVEKRPLGSATPTGTESVNKPESSETKDKDEDADDPSLPASNEETSPMPIELGSDIVAIEADSPQAESKAEEQRVSDVVAKNGMTPSIVQQYKEQPSSADSHHAALYDSAPEKPLSHPPKKKSGWITIVWVLLLVVVLGALAGGLYYFKII